eukprot:1178016-Prorocentrum_minimum.AAC.3
MSYVDIVTSVRQRVWAMLRPQPSQPTITIVGRTLDRKRALICGVALLLLVRYIPLLSDGDRYIWRVTES